MKIQEIPLQGVSEIFEVELQSVTYQLRVKWNHKLKQWALDIARGTQWIIRNLAMVAGQDLLLQYSHLNFAFELWVQVDGDRNADATFDNLGTKARLLVITDD